MLHGNNIYISMDGSRVPFAGTQSDTIKSGCKEIEISGPNTGKWEECIAGRNNWQLNVKWMVSAGDDISNLLMSGNTYNIGVFTARNKLVPTLVGRALCTSADVQAQKGNISYGTFSFRGTGPLAPPVNVSSITLSAQTLSVRVGSSSMLTASILPANASIKKLIWETSNGTVAQVYKNGGVSGMTPGTCTITCRAADGSGIVATCTVNVSQ